MGCCTMHFQLRNYVSEEHTASTLDPDNGGSMFLHNAEIQAEDHNARSHCIENLKPYLATAAETLRTYILCRRS